MSAKKYPELDLDASLGRLSEWLAGLRANGYDFGEDSRRYHGLATKLMSTAALLDGQEWFYLECGFDEDPPHTIGADGLPIPYPGNNAARYKILLSQLRELAETAERLADENPKPRTKPEIPMAADFFLHLWLASGNKRPTLYEHGPAVTALAGALSAAGYCLSNERVRGILTEALNKFDPHFCLDQWRLDRLMVWRQ
jgi:hypothetical protein